MLISVKTTPRSSRNELVKISDVSFKAYVTAAPEKGKANDAVIKLLAEHFHVAKTNISLKAGASSREKLFELK